MSKSTDATRAIAERLGALPPFPTDRFDGRGIVICAGGVRMFINAYVLVRVLREILRCALPIELWHLGPGELSPAREVADSMPDWNPRAQALRRPGSGDARGSTWIWIPSHSKAPSRAGSVARDCQSSNCRQITVSRTLARTSPKLKAGLRRTLRQ